MASSLSGAASSVSADRHGAVPHRNNQLITDCVQCHALPVILCWRGTHCWHSGWLTDTEKILHVLRVSAAGEEEEEVRDAPFPGPPSSCTSSSSFMMVVCVCSTSKPHLIHHDSYGFLCTVRSRRDETQVARISGTRSQQRQMTGRGHLQSLIALVTSLATPSPDPFSPTPPRTLHGGGAGEGVGSLGSGGEGGRRCTAPASLPSALTSDSQPASPASTTITPTRARVEAGKERVEEEEQEEEDSKRLVIGEEKTKGRDVEVRG
ncbi:hypothetical protein O3P69_001980 [Scylla paramamosain]|uniref:Uncharacterized protein n=1 Tax=Scylla paramamosain TaxID=85552 RepID=A0AAW0V5G6_SCYPA